MKKLDAIVIAKNEEEVIESALRSLSFCDEILVVDNYSTDKTEQISKKEGARVIKFKSTNFSALRNFGKNNLDAEYILYVDADEVVSEELKKSILFEIKSNSSLAAYKVKRKNFYLGKNEWPMIEEMTRLFKSEKLHGWEGEIHESPKIEGSVGKLDGFLLHHTHRNLSQMLDKTIEWSDIEGKLRFDAKHPKMTWWRFPRVMIGTFLNYYIVQKGYRLGTAGLVESMYQSFSTFITYAKLWELQNKR